MYKTCSQCKEEKELNRDNFEPRKNSKDGYRNQCKDCRNEMRRKNYIPSDNNWFWSKEEESIVIEHYPYMSAKEINKIFLQDRTPEQITDFATKKLNLKKDVTFRSNWSSNQISYLKRNYSDFNIPLEDISLTIGKSKFTITAMANALGLFRQDMWSDEEKESIKKYYPHIKTSELKEKFIKDKTVSQITKYANENSIFKTEETLNKIKTETAINNLIDLNGNKEPTKPERVISELLNKMSIEYDFQDFQKYYWLDFYLPENNLIIEVQGDYFHCNPLMNFTYKALDKNKILTKDKRKHSYFKNKNIEILYLWESDIINSLEKCELLIKKYIDNNGVLNNYHSFNYSILNNSLIESVEDVAIGY